jgi:hypothetical protein
MGRRSFAFPGELPPRQTPYMPPSGFAQRLPAAQSDVTMHAKTALGIMQIGMMQRSDANSILMSGLSRLSIFRSINSASGADVMFATTRFYLSRQ